MSADFWAGYLSGAAAIVVGNPLDVIKVRLQATAAHTARSTIDVATATNKPSTSLSIFRDVGNLVKGLPAPIVTYGALNALLFWSYNRSLALFPSTHPAAPLNITHQPTGDGSLPIHSPLAHFAAGAIAGLATFVISSPTELVKCRAQVAISRDPSVPHTSWAITKDIWRRHGLRGMYVGGVVTSLRDSIGYGFYFWSYEVTTRAWMQAKAGQSRGSQSQSTYWEDQTRILICGGLAGVITWLSVFPLDVVKSRVQTQSNLLSDLETRPLLRDSPNTGLSRAPVASDQAYGALQISKEMLRTEGMSAFFRGLTVCSVRAFIVNAVQWATYEWAVSVLR